VSQLRVSGQGQQDFYLNVLSFDTPITGEMNSAQTKSQVQYFPIKAFQPELSCNVIFPSEALWEQWQAWVRQNMLNAQKSNSTGNPGVTLNWPERNINNWTGVIGAAKAGGMRRNYTPYTQIEFQLVVSLVSNLDIFASFASGWKGIFGNTTVGGNVDSLFTLAENFLGGSTTAGVASLFNTTPSDLGSALLGGNTVQLPSVNTVTNSLSSFTSLLPGLTSSIGGGIIA
jgi:hypothetical protein